MTLNGCWVDAIGSIFLSHKHKIFMFVFAYIVPFVNGEYGHFTSFD